MDSISTRLAALKAPYDYNSQPLLTERNSQTDAIILAVYEYAIKNLPPKSQHDSFVKFLNARYVLGTFQKGSGLCEILFHYLITYHEPKSIAAYSLLLRYIYEIELCVPSDIIQKLIVKVESWI